MSGKNHGWADIFKTITPNEWTDIFGRYKCESINDIILANDPTTDSSGDVISGGRGDRHET